MWLDTRLTQTSIQASNPQPRGASSSEVNSKRLWITITIVYIHPFNGYRDLNSYKRLWITITIVYIHPFNGYRDLNSYMKTLAINANGNTITSFAREHNPTGVGGIYIYLSIYLSIYIYIYMCVCVCVCTHVNTYAIYLIIYIVLLWNSRGILVHAVEFS